jgi:hypothetical protein
MTVPFTAVRAATKGDEDLKSFDALAETTARSSKRCFGTLFATTGIIKNGCLSCHLPKPEAI